MPLLVEKHASRTEESEKSSDEVGKDHICPMSIPQIMRLHMTVNVNVIRARAGRLQAIVCHRNSDNQG
jgi:hypothetical protein